MLRGLQAWLGYTRTVSVGIEASCAENGTTPALVYLLCVLSPDWESAESPAALRVIDIARALLVKRNTASMLVKRAKEAGLVDATPSLESGRESAVCITQYGRDVLQSVLRSLPPDTALTLSTLA